MFLLILPEYYYTVCVTHRSWATLKNVIHSFLEHILAQVQSEWKTFEPIPSKWTVECGQVAGWFIQGHIPISVAGIKFGEYSWSGEVVGDLIRRGRVVVRTLNRSVQIPGIKANVQLVVRFAAVHDDWYQDCWRRHFRNDSELLHFLKLCLDFVLHINGTSAWWMDDGRHGLVYGDVEFTSKAADSFKPIMVSVN